MRSPQSMRRNGEAAISTPSSSPRPRLPPPIPLTATPSPHPTFHSTVSLQKLRRFNSLVLVFRVVTFIFSLSSSVFMLTNYHSGSDSEESLRWFDFDAFRFVLAAGAIVAMYSLFEMVAAVWEITRSTTVLPEFLQVFAYMLLSAESAGTAMAKSLKSTDTCTSTGSFCLQSDISVALGFVAFLFLAFSSLLSGYRVVSFLLNGTRFHF
ncbi:hypothetical protein V2J09_002475 [Rumex salicifolius]